jgi:hypothetical protein
MSLVGIDSCGYILTENNIIKLIKYLNIGDKVATIDENNKLNYTTIKDIKIYKIINPIYVCNINNLIIPINQEIKFNYDNDWIYPNKIYYPHLATFNYLHEIYLEESNNIIVNNIIIRTY